MNAMSNRVLSWWRQFTCRLEQARRLRRDLQELAQMGANDLRDIGISHAQVAAMAAIKLRCP